MVQNSIASHLLSRDKSGLGLFPRMHLSKISATFAATCLSLIPALSHAASISVSGQLTVSQNYGSEFVTGDTFNFNFTLIDTATDSRAETYAGQFAPGVSGFSLVRGSGNVGTWNPVNGVFAAVHNFYTDANGDSITLQVGGSGFPQLGSSNFLDVGLTFDWDSSVRDFVDTGSGQTFAELVGTSGLDFSTASSFYPELRNASYDGPIMTMSVTGVPTAVPEPTSYAAGPLALLCAILYRRRRR